MDLVVNVPKRQFCSWHANSKTFSEPLRKALESELVKSATKFCVRNGMKASDIKIDKIQIGIISYTFVVVGK